MEYDAGMVGGGNGRIFLPLPPFFMEQKQQPIAKADEQNMQGGSDKDGKGRDSGPCPYDRIVDSDGNHQEDGRLYDHVPDIPGKGHLFFQGIQMQAGQQQFAGQHSPKIGGDAQAGDAKQDEGEAEQQGRDILQKGGGGPSQAI